ncbi:MAG: hypothetical protein R2873_07715 [Caldilineaceae bacterium]|nr:hypothetical protein [Caldilineaceae bacterium]
MNRNLDTHIKIVGWLNIASGILLLLIAALVFFILVFAGIISNDQDAMLITGLVGVFVGGFLAVLSIPGILGGYGLLRGLSWARYLTLVVSFLNLFNVPIGTVVGGYSIWVLLQPEAPEAFH